MGRATITIDYDGSRIDGRPDIDGETAEHLWRDALHHEAEQLGERHDAKVEVVFAETPAQRWRIFEVGPDGQIGGALDLGDQSVDSVGTPFECEAADAFEALCAYADEMGFAPYTRAESDAEYDRINDAGGDEGIPAQWSPAHEAWVGVFTNMSIGAYPVRTLTATFDVTGLKEAEVERFSGYVEAQTEGGNESWEYPPLPGKTGFKLEPEFPRAETRTVTVHLSVALPADAPATADDVADEVIATLTTHADPATTPALAVSPEICVVPLAEEI